MNIALPKIVAIGIYDSKLAVKNKAITKNRRTTMFEIEIPIEKGGISYIEKEQCPIDTNMIICAKPGQLRHTRLPFKCYYIKLIVNDGALYDILMSVPAFTITTKYEEYLEIFKTICKYQETEVESDNVILQSLVLKLVYMLNKDSKKQLYAGKLKNSGYDVIGKSINYIKDHITEDLSLDAVSKNASLSPIHFHNTFKVATGKTLHEYVEEERIKKAVGLLTTTALTLSEIAYNCGFSSQAYFSYVFKRRMNMTPREYARDMYEKYSR